MPSWLRPWLAAAAGLAVVAIVLIAIGDIARSIGYGVIGLILLLATSLAFYAVGRSEDEARERERERERRGGA